MREERTTGLHIVKGSNELHGGATLLVKQKDAAENLIYCEGTTLPTVGTAGFAFNCRLVLTNAVLGMSAEWRNFGSTTSSLFVPVSGPVNGYGFVYGGLGVVAAGGDVTETWTQAEARVTTDLLFAQHSVSNDSDTISEATITARDTVTLIGSADPVSTQHEYEYFGIRLRPPFQPWLVKLAGTRVAVGGDTTAVAITATGALATDMGFAQYVATDDSDTLDKAIVTADTLTLTVSADPVTDHSWDYFILSPFGLFQPTHYIAYAGNRVAVGGDTTTVVITATGALATDKVLVSHATSDDNDTISVAVVTADTITLTVSADPVTDHSYNWMLLRAY